MCKLEWTVVIFCYGQLTVAAILNWGDSKSADRWLNVEEQIIKKEEEILFKIKVFKNVWKADDICHNKSGSHERSYNW